MKELYFDYVLLCNTPIYHMKIVIIVAVMFLLSWCFWESADIKKAKEEMWIIASDKPIVDNSNNREAVNGWSTETSTSEEAQIQGLSSDKRISIDYTSGDKVLELPELKYEDFKNGYVKIRWKTLTNVEKIIVTFSNNNSNFPDDSFQLQKFKSGDSIFEYNASSKFKVLDFGTNIYTFKAHHSGWISELVLKVLVSENDDKFLDWTSNISREVFQSEKSADFSAYPEWEKYGNKIKIKDNEIAYSWIKWLSIKQEKVWALTCWKDPSTNSYYISDFLKGKMSSWYYWNTCRDIVKDRIFSFYVVRLEWEKYLYEKHYIDTKNGFYGTFKIEEGTWVDKNNISAKNSELKLKNSDFTQSKVVDELFIQAAK